MFEEICAVVVAVGFLHAFYRALATRWPANYMSMASGVEYAATRTPGRYMLFRLGPVALACLFVAVTLARLEQAVVVPVAAAAGVHWAITSGRAAWELRRGRRRHPLVLLHLSLLILLLLTALMATALRSRLAPLIPSLDEVAASLWTALVAGVVGAYLVHASSAPPTDIYEAFRVSQASIADDVWSSVDDAAAQSLTDANLLRAIMLVENIQRPKWFRVLERAKGLLIKPGSYGVMQVPSDRPVSDLESVYRAAARLANVPIPMTGDGPRAYPDMDAVRRAALRYNADSSYADNVVAAYGWLISR